MQKCVGKTNQLKIFTHIYDINVNNSPMRKANFLLILCLNLGILGQCQTDSLKKSKINGLSFVASRDTIQQKHITPVLKMQTNWVSVMPFGFMKALDSHTLHYNHTRQWYGERIDGVKQSIEMMHKNNIKVMLKPQIWIGNGDFTGDISMLNDNDWQSFEEQYKTMILDFAKVAEETQTEMLCIGTELNSFVRERPEFWVELISLIRAVYSGPLTYAENWDKMDKVHFWSSLDYIGVDAYFPISDAQTPDIEAVKTRWEIINTDLKTLSETHKRPILFTEFGYRSLDYAGKAPWNSVRVEGQVNEKAQAVLLRGLTESVWDKHWFAGGFLWKWFHQPEEYKDWQENRFSVHGKEAEAVVRGWYARY